MVLAAFVVIMSVLLDFCSDDAKQKLEQYNLIMQENKELAAIAELEQQGKLPKLDRTNSLTGIDANNNGIRDDIEEYIDKNYIPEMHNAARGFARAMQKTLLVPPNDREAAREPDMESSLWLECIFLVSNKLEEQGKIEEDNYWYRVSREIEAINANTKKRFKAYMAFNKSLDGTTSYNFDDEELAEVCYEQVN